MGYLLYPFWVFHFYVGAVDLELPLPRELAQQRLLVPDALGRPLVFILL